MSRHNSCISVEHIIFFFIIIAVPLLLLLLLLYQLRLVNNIYIGTVFGIVLVLLF
jgi:hypothetical protein